jgi:hypothetical protein
VGIDGSAAGDDAEDTTLIGGNGGNGGPGAVIIEYKRVE